MYLHSVYLGDMGTWTSREAASRVYRARKEPLQDASRLSCACDGSVGEQAGQKGSIKLQVSVRGSRFEESWLSFESCRRPVSGPGHGFLDSVLRHDSNM